LVDTRHATDSTEFELVSYPLDNCGRPQFDQPSSGRFLVVSPGYVETADIRPGRSLTATGRLIGVREGTVAGAAYRFPLLEDPAPRLAPEATSRGRGSRPVFSVGIGAGTGWRGGGIGVYF
jgi:outer membrane lipoprotein